MEEIFANHGYKSIVLKILNYLDTESMVNLIKVSKTVSFNMKSIKTCQMYFNKCIPNLPISTKLGISKSHQFEMKTKFQNDLKADELMELFNHLKQLGDLAKRQEFKKRSHFNEQIPFPEINPQHFTHLSQNIQPKIQPIWELFDALYNMDMVLYLAMDQGVRRFENVKCLDYM